MKIKQYVHLHVHSHYSIMDGCNTIPQLADRAIKNRMTGMALTDTGFWFYRTAIVQDRKTSDKKTKIGERSNNRCG